MIRVCDVVTKRESISHFFLIRPWDPLCWPLRASLGRKITFAVVDRSDTRSTRSMLDAPSVKGVADMHILRADSRVSASTRDTIESDPDRRFSCGDVECGGMQDNAGAMLIETRWIK